MSRPDRKTPAAAIVLVMLTGALGAVVGSNLSANADNVWARLAWVVVGGIGAGVVVSAAYALFLRTRRR